MSDLYNQGFEYEKQGDYKTALSLYEQAANQGDDRAECRIGNIYRFGRGWEKD